MRLHIANVTKQNQTVCYRIDRDKEGFLIESSGRHDYKQFLIPRGKQGSIEGTEAQMKAVIEQLGRVGAVMLDDARAGRWPHRKQVPYVLSLDKTVPASVMQDIYDVNMGNLSKEGLVRRRKAAIEASKTVDDVIAATNEQTGADFKEPGLFQSGVEQLGGEETTGKDRLVEHFDVNENNELPANQKNKRPPRKRSRG